MPEPRHKCPAPGCSVMVVQSQLACRPHWFSIPAPIRSRLWSAYRSHDSSKHAQALADAVSFLRSAPMPGKVPEGVEFQPGGRV